MAAAPPACFNYGSADAYAQAVRAWVFAYQAWSFGQHMAPIYAQQQLMMQQHQQQMFAGYQPTAAPAAAVQPPISGARTYQAASFGRRIGAEMVDFCFCFALKLVMVYTLVELKIIDLERYDRLLSDQADLQTLIDVTQDLFPVEVLNKIITSLIEAVYISYGVGAVPSGCTPGKALMGLRVIACHELHAVGQPRDNRIAVVGPDNVDFRSSLLRSLFKNLTLSFMFPLCVVMYAFRYNRSVYEMASRTIVVQV